jgi:hypothetical protein
MECVMRAHRVLSGLMAVAACLTGNSIGWGAERSVSVTIYTNDLALVQDTREIQVQAGRQRVEFQDVSGQIRPETVSLTASDISIVEQNFDFDLLTPGKLMEKAVGQQVTLVRVNPSNGAETREQARVLATNGGVVLKIGDHIEVLRDDGLPLGDYYLYPLAERTTIANMQTKQVSFLDVHGVPAQHGYEFRNGWLQTQDQPQSAQTVYSFSTSAHAGLGDQLPAGVLRFYMRDRRGDPQFIGESRIDHTPMGSTLSLATGDAFDVKVQAIVDKRTQLSLFDWKSDMRYELTNALPRQVVVKVLQGGLFGDTRITTESIKSVRRSAEVTEWDVTVPANGKATLTASFETRY